MESVVDFFRGMKALNLKQVTEEAGVEYSRLHRAVRYGVKVKLTEEEVRKLRTWVAVFQQQVTHKYENFCE